MFYKNWMSYLKDEAKITKIVMPGSHNSATMGMNKLGRCQCGSLYEQYLCGVRYFDIRIKADKKGRLFAAHGIMKGMPAEQVFENLKKILDESDEFFIIDIKTYMNQKFGPIKLSYNSNTDEANRLITEYLSPEKYALTDFNDIRNVTMGDIRKTGKKYIITNADKEYVYSCDCPIAGPWDSVVYGFEPEKFIKEIQKYLLEIESEGFFWFQTQQTPNPGTMNGWKSWPDDLDKPIRKLFPKLISDIAADPVKLERINIIAGDFMSQDYMKASHILRLNLLKDTVKDELREKFENCIK